MATPLERFTTLFTGLQRAHGSYSVNLKAEGEKMLGPRGTKQAPVTAALYEQHLSASNGLGIVPVNDDGVCWFAALDIDQYSGAYVKYVERVRDNNLPFVPCLTKSGGLHLYLFFSEPVQAKLIREKLKVLSDGLGVPGCEVFPKQDNLGQADYLGSWINLPYLGGGLSADKTSRVMVDPRTMAKVPELEKFLDVAEHLRISASQLDALTISSGTVAPFRDGPPCIQKLCSAKVHEGGRNNAMFQVGVYFRTKHKKESGYGDSMLLELMRKANRNWFEPPMDDVEVINTCRSVYRDKHFYRCEEEPMRSVCNKPLCMTRKFGVGEQNVDMRLDFGPLVKYYVADDSGRQSVDQPWYVWTLNGQMIRFDGDALGNMRRYGEIVFQYLKIYPPMMKEDAWRKFITECMAAADEVGVPFEAGKTGQLVGHVRDFIRDYGTRYTWDALLSGDVYVDRGQMRAYFRWQDLKAYLGRKSIRDSRENDLWEVLRKYFDGKSGSKSLQGRSQRYWDIKVEDKDLRPPEDAHVDF